MSVRLIYRSVCCFVFASFLIKRKNRKIYANFKKHFGTLTISVRKGGDLRHVIIGLIKGISDNIEAKRLA